MSKTVETGLVIKNGEGKYYGGLHNLVPKLHSAKIYVSEKYVKEALEECKTSDAIGLKYQKDKNYRIVRVEIRELD
jgi:hypothetical protein